MSHSRVKRGSRIAIALCGSAVVLASVAIAPTVAYADPAPAPVAPNLVFEENFENGTGVNVIGLTDYTGAQGADYTADPFWLNAAACNGLILQGGANWTGAGAPCASSESRARLTDLAGVLGGGNTSNHLVAAYTDANGPAGQTLLAKSAGSGIEVVDGRFYVASIDIAEVNCFAATDSTIAFGLVLPSGEIMIDGNPAVACAQGQTTTVNGHAIKYGTFYSAGFKSPEAGSAEYVVRNLATSGAGNDFAYDNLRFYDATPTLHKSFNTDTVEVGQPVTMQLTVVNTSELSEKTGWAFTDNMPAGMTIAAEPNETTTCAAADIVADADSSVLQVTDGSISTGTESCTISVDVVLAAGGSFTNVVPTAEGLDGTPSATVRALVPSLSLTKTVVPQPLTADQLEATYTFTVVNDGEIDLHDVAVSDPGPIGGTGVMGPIDCGETTDLAVGAELVCTAVYTASLDDINGSDLTNEATATGLTPAGTLVDASSTAVLPTEEPKPELSLVKSANTDLASAAGQVINYSFLVTNTGNVTVRDVAIAEGQFSGAGTLGAVTCPPAAKSLAPAATVTCTASYTVVAADLTGKAITNTATANGVGPNGPVASAVSAASVKTPVPSSAASLAHTGFEAGSLLAAGALGLLLVGTLTAATARRKRVS